MLWHLGWRSTQKFDNRTIAQMQFPCAAQIEDPGQRKCMRNGFFKRSQAQSEMASGRVSSDAQALEVKLTGRPGLFCLQQMIGAANVLKSSRPAAARITDTPVFNIPGCNASFG